MTCSPEQMASNRRNAQKSTGPKTDAGKAISRQNSFKHGLTGEGVVMPSDDAEAVAIRIGNIKNQLKPGTELGEVFVEQIAVLAVRLGRCHLQEVEVVTNRVNQALREFDDNLLDEADALFHNLGESPSSTLRRLFRTEQGIQRLVKGWSSLKVALDCGVWKSSHGERLAHLMGFRADDCDASVLLMLSEGVQGRFDAARPSKMDIATRVASAKSSLGTLIDDQVVSLTSLLAELDPAIVEQRRAEVIMRAKLDAAPVVYQIQKYEAATERSLTRLLKEARLVELAPTLIEQARQPLVKKPVAASAKPVKPSSELGSISQTQPPPKAKPAGMLEFEDEALMKQEEELYRLMTAPEPKNKARIAELLGQIEQASKAKRQAQ